MNRSSSTPRVRTAAAYYALLVCATAFAGRPGLRAAVDALTSFTALTLVSVAALGRIWCSLFIAGRKDTELVTSGPYALCRHPLYLLSLLGGLGIGIATRSWVLALLTVAVLAALHISAARQEERALTTQHGGAYQAYAASVPRWSPRWRNWRAAGPVEVETAIFFKAFVDGGAFLLLYALIEGAYRLRTAGVTPTLLALP